VEEYPSLAEGIGLENRQAGYTARGFESLLLRHIVNAYIIVAGWSSPVARRAHNPKVAGSNPAPAIALHIAIFYKKDDYPFFPFIVLLFKD
jgi:hypothetical protein